MASVTVLLNRINFIVDIGTKKDWKSGNHRIRFLTICRLLRKFTYRPRNLAWNILIL